MSSLITDKELKEIQELFNQFDTSGEGQLDVGELKKLTDALKIMCSEADLTIMMDILDEDGGGSIDCGELLGLIDQLLAEIYSGDEIIESFKSIACVEEVGEGEIDSKKLSAAMGLAGVYITEEDVTALVEEVDDSGDGLIDFNEFRNTVLGF